MRSYQIIATRVSTGEVTTFQIQARSLAEAAKKGRSELPFFARYDVSAAPVRWSKHLPLAAARKRASWADEVFDRRPGLVSVT